MKSKKKEATLVFFPIFCIVITFITENVEMATSEVTQETIVKDIKSIKPEQAILEIITNAIDA